ncbi:MAG: CPBP family intramembrane metalloprotease [Gammaproteobacteria bacterium]|nr:CPBP family intramembrane metalloprotease [Gammaproteobacteria bacterium]
MTAVKAAAIIAAALAAAYTLSLGVVYIQARLQTLFGEPAYDIAYLIKIPVFFGLTYYANKYVNRVSSLDYLGDWRKIPRHLFAGFGIGAILSLATLYIAALHPDFNLPSLAALREGAAVSLASLSLFTLITGVWEELFFRGLIFVSLLVHFRNLHAAAIISSVVFFLPHIFFGNPLTTWIWLTGVGFFGMTVAYLYHISGSIWLVAGLHAAWNFIGEISESGAEHYGLIVVPDYTGHREILESAALGLVILTTIITAVFAAKQTPPGLSIKLR